MGLPRGSPVFFVIPAKARIQANRTGRKSVRGDPRRTTCWARTHYSRQVLRQAQDERILGALPRFQRNPLPRSNEKIPSPTMGEG